MSTKNTNTKTPNPNNPSSLPPRYEIRKLEPEHIDWANAIACHANYFYSPVWNTIYSENIAKRLFGGLAGSKYLCEHQIESGLSYGVFDTEYVFKREESKATGGKLYWDENEPSVQEEKGQEAESQRLLEQMDFPLVSIALSYDGFVPLDGNKLGPLLQALPLFGPLGGVLAARDQRDPASWQPTGPGQVLTRNSTATKKDYEGQGLMSGMARWLMREADQKGFRGIGIVCVHAALDRIWANPEAPYKGITVSEFDTGTYEDEEGKLKFAPAKQRVTKIYVELKPKE